MSETDGVGSLHGVLNQKLSDNGRNHFNRENENRDQRLRTCHNFSSIFATRLPTIASPRMTIVIPHQRRGEMYSARKIQQLSGTSTWTTLESGSAIESGIYFKTLIQQRKLRITSAIAHQIQIEVSDSRPVHSQPATRSVLDAPTFKSVSEAVTKSASKASSNQGFGKRRGPRSITRYIWMQKYFRKVGSDFGGTNMGMGATNFNLRSKSGAVPFARREIGQSSFAFGNRRKTGSCRVGSKYFNTRRKIGFKNARVCMT